MKINLRTVLLLVGVSLIVSGSYALAHTDVTAEQARELIDSTDDLIVIDVREPSEYSDTGGHIPGALNYPWYSGVFHAQYGELPMHSPVLVVCGSGSRSNRAADFLDSEGFSMVYDMLRGMRAWIWETETGVDADIKYGGGTGEPDGPYQIATAEDLILLGETPEDYDKHFILTADIDLDPNLPGRKVFDRAVIAPDINDVELDFQGTPFTGVFDGNGYMISHLTIQGQGCLGLFGKLESGVNVKNLGVVDVNITDSGLYVGGLVGENKGSISVCYSTGVVNGGRSVGGLVGYNSNNGDITNCSSNCMVSGFENIGGLLGHNFSGRVTRCFSTGFVTGFEDVGGLVGDNDAHVNDSLWDDNDANIIDSFWDMETSTLPYSEGGTGKTTAEMQTLSTFLEAGWDFVGETENGTEDIWSICEGTNYPRFVWQIAAGDFVCPDGITIDDFSFFMEHWLDDNCDLSNGYCQGTDLDQSGTVDVNDLEIFFENWPAER